MRVHPRRKIGHHSRFYDGLAQSGIVGGNKRLLNLNLRLVYLFGGLGKNPESQL